MNFDAEYANAKERVGRFDQLDRRKDREPGTILAALEAGLRHPETGAQFDALVMLKDVVEATKGVAR